MRYNLRVCTLLFAHDCHPHYRLCVLANRDESYARATLPLSQWDDAPDIRGGRDAVKGGTWLGATQTGRWAAITNFREPIVSPDPRAPSRGLLVAKFLEGHVSPQAYVHTLQSTADRYPGFNLIVGEFVGDVWWLSNRGPQPQRVEPGIHGLSNRHLDTPWPKVEAGCHRLREVLEHPEKIADTDFLQILADDTTYADARLPDTGVGIALERMLAPLRIDLEHYGTVSSTLLTVTREGAVRMVERPWKRGQAGELRILSW